MASQSLAELEEELDTNEFCRVHRSGIVNFKRVRGLQLNEDGEYEVVLEGGTRVRLSRRYRKHLEARLGVYGDAAQKRS